jgi:hypothetical protein
LGLFQEAEVMDVFFVMDESNMQASVLQLLHYLTHDRVLVVVSFEVATGNGYRVSDAEVGKQLIGDFMGTGFLKSHIYVPILTGTKLSDEISKVLEASQSKDDTFGKHPRAT